MNIFKMCDGAAEWIQLVQLEMSAIIRSKNFMIKVPM